MLSMLLKSQLLSKSNVAKCDLCEPRGYKATRLIFPSTRPFWKGGWPFDQFYCGGLGILTFAVQQLFCRWGIDKDAPP